MLKTDEGALICDLAETYHVYDWRSLPVRTVATLAAGLRDDARIHLRMAGLNHSLDRMLLAGIYDAARVANWQRSKDGTRGTNKPELMAQRLMKVDAAKAESAVESFADGDAFRRAREKLLNGC